MTTTYCCPEKEYQALRMVADTAFGLCARYPFDTPEALALRWHILAKWLALLPDYTREEVGRHEAS